MFCRKHVVLSENRHELASVKVAIMSVRHALAIVITCGLCLAWLPTSHSQPPRPAVKTSPAASKLKSQRVQPAAAVTGTKHIVSVKVYWTPQVETYWGGAYGISSAVANLETRMNMAIRDATIPRGIPTEPYDYLEMDFLYDTGGSSKIALPNGPPPLNAIGDDYYSVVQVADMMMDQHDRKLDEIHWTREMTGIDYVVLLKMPKTGDAYGHSLGIQEGPFDPDYPKFGFSAVTAIKTDWGWTGTDFTGPHRFSMAHELCHLMGLDHQRGEYGWKPYSYGHTYEINGLLYGTLEATDEVDPGLIREMRFSDSRPDNFGNPSIYGIPELADSARHLREYCIPIAATRPDIASSNTTLQIISPPSVTGKVGSPFNYQIDVNLPPGTTPNWHGVKWPLPEGLSIDEDTGTIYGTPSEEVDSNYPVGARWGAHTASMNLHISISGDDSGCIASSVLVLQKLVRSTGLNLPDLGNIEKLNILRQFRDEILKSTPEGQALVDAYYHLSPALVEWSRQDPQRVDQCVQLLEDLLPPILRADPLHAYRIDLPCAVAQRCVTLLKSINTSSDDELKQIAESAEIILQARLKQNPSAETVSIKFAEFAAALDFQN